MAIGTPLVTRQNVTDFLQFAAPAGVKNETGRKWLKVAGSSAAALFLWGQKTEAESSFKQAQSYHTAAANQKIKDPGKIDPFYENIETIAFKNLNIHLLCLQRARFYSLSGKMCLVGGVFLGVGIYNEIAWLKKASSGVILFSLIYFIGRLLYHWRDYQKIESLRNKIAPLREQAYKDLDQIPEAEPAK